MVVNRNTIRKLIYVHIAFVLFFLYANTQLGLPWGVIYLLDIMMVLEIIWSYPTMKRIFREADFMYLYKYIFIFVFFLFITQIINFVPIKLAVVAYRRTFRFILFFISCACLLTLKDVDKILNFFVKAQVLNIIMSLYQYFIKGLKQDNLGGIFGTQTGANMYSNIFLCIICTYVLVMYLMNRAKMESVLFVVGSSLIIAILAELKVFFFELVIIVVLAMIFTRTSLKTIKIVVICIFGLAASLVVFSKLFPEHMAVLSNLDSFLKYTTGNTWGYNISRFNAFSEINNLFFKEDMFKSIIGYGFGNCSMGSAFYNMYSQYHYTWFTHQLTLLETGYLGFLIYILFYILIFRYASKMKNRIKENAAYYIIVQIMSLLCMVFIIYDQALMRECAYLVFFVLSIAVIASKKNTETGVNYAKERFGYK